MNVRRSAVDTRSALARRGSAVIMVALLVGPVLAGCGPSDTPAAGATSAGSANASGAQGAGSGRVDGCLAGTWTVDVAALASDAAALMKTGTGTGTADGSITLTFADALTIHYATTMTVFSQTSGTKIGIKDSYAGDAVSNDYTAKDGKIHGTMSGQGVTKSTSVIVGSQVQPAKTGTISGTLDLSQGLTTYTCSATAATLNNGTVTWHLTKA